MSNVEIPEKWKEKMKRITDCANQGYRYYKRTQSGRCYMILRKGTGFLSLGAWSEGKERILFKLFPKLPFAKNSRLVNHEVEDVKPSIFFVSNDPLLKLAEADWKYAEGLLKRTINVPSVIELVHYISVEAYIRGYRRNNRSGKKPLSEMEDIEHE